MDPERCKYEWKEGSRIEIGNAHGTKWSMLAGTRTVLGLYLVSTKCFIRIRNTPQKVTKSDLAREQNKIRCQEVSHSISQF